ncbi:hypothetical protein PIB30_080663 [Stylosanthes scabra]|uniref:Uncharacterized protein n=1 Tax=Stylosanthes scabra TaxID=79078 RepID=A0ABU6ZQ72_9FABA|nr:hypothetical protein [Stylosanthes scabra]
MPRRDVPRLGSFDQPFTWPHPQPPASVFDDYRFRTEFNQTLFESIVRKKKVIPEVGFNLDEDEYPQIKEQIALRRWRRLAAPITDINKLLV